MYCPTGYEASNVHVIPCCVTDDRIVVEALSTATTSTRQLPIDWPLLAAVNVMLVSDHALTLCVTPPITTLPWDAPKPEPVNVTESPSCSVEGEMFVMERLTALR